MLGRMHSIQSFSTLDGPGIRFVLFLQGCPLRCACCHNPDTWDAAGGTEIDDAQAFARILRCRDYFGEEGGVTVSGGEPLLQSGFVRSLFARCREAGIHTALDTSGCILTDEALSVLDVTDLCRSTTKCPRTRCTGATWAARSQGRSAFYRSFRRAASTRGFAASSSPRSRTARRAFSR